MEKEIKNLPYTIVSHTAIQAPRLSILLTAEGISAIAKKVKKGDMVRITEWSDYSNECKKVKHYGEISIIPKEDY